MNLRIAIQILLGAAVTTSTVAAEVHDGDRPTSFPLEGRPEGITNGPGSTLLVGEIMSGRIVSIDALTGETTEKVGEQSDGRQAWGLWHYDDVIFVAGGGQVFGGGKPQVYVYSATDGSALATCDPLSTNTDLNAAFINDVTVVGGTAYVTDSMNNMLMSFDADEAINNGECVVSEVQLSEDFKPIDGDDWGPNGIVGYADGLLVVHEVRGFVHHISNLDGDAPVYQEIIPPGGVNTGDGLNVLDDKLYITRNYANVIDVYQLDSTDPDAITATFLGNITSPEYATPATSALYDGYIYSANSQFADFDVEVQAPNDMIVGVNNVYDDHAADDGDEVKEDEIPADQVTEDETKEGDTGSSAGALSAWYAAVAVGATCIVSLFQGI